ncbi:MAG: cyclodeaminase/cyclohydrolase family protein, partial [marine benthic group bacterium]|nr:cyclodeaminase/cyclohydrolase family protein [Gemmatimonadota bacterium]
EKAARSAAIQEGMVGATRVPLENGTRCVRVLELADRLSASFNQNAESDLAVARSLASSGAEGCLANVEINLSSVKDDEVKAEIEARANELRSVYDVVGG